MSPGTLHPGNLGRWFEELCRFRHQRLQEIAVSTGIRLAANALPDEGGVYAFWWTGSTTLLQKKMSREIVLKGPSEKPVPLHFSDEWLGLSTKLPIPLYVGKTAAGLSNRIGRHLLLGHERALPLGKESEKAEHPTTSCQLRGGIDHIFPNERDTRTLMLENVGLSFVLLDGDVHAAHRFYLEDLAIGMMHPPFNVDIER